MTKREFGIWAQTLKACYPTEKNLLPSNEAIELWYRHFIDLPYDTAIAALQKWVQTEKWSPTIADIRGMCAEMTAGKTADWGSAWEEVTRAIRKYGYSEQEKALDSMSPLTQNAVEKLGWRAICLSDNADVIRAQFRQVYEICAKRETEDRQLSPQLKATINSLLEDRNNAMLESGRRPMLNEGAT